MYIAPAFDQRSVLPQTLIGSPIKSGEHLGSLVAGECSRLLFVLASRFADARADTGDDRSADVAEMRPALPSLPRYDRVRVKTYSLSLLDFAKPHLRLPHRALTPR